VPHECKYENRINRMDREQGEFKVSLTALIDRFDVLIKVGIAVGVVGLTSTLTTLGFLIIFWVKNIGGS
jgi:hypothetical protein